MSWNMYVAIESEKQAKAIARAKKAGISDPDEAAALVKKYESECFTGEHGVKQYKRPGLVMWARSVHYGTRILAGQVKRW